MRWHTRFLAAENIARAADELNALLLGSHFCLVQANSYDEKSDRFIALDVTPSQVLTMPFSARVGELSSLSWVTPRYSMGVHTPAQTVRDAIDGERHDQVRITIDGQQVTFDHYAPARYRLQWILAVEYHDEASDA